MELLQKFKRHVTRKTDITDHCLHTMRYRKLLEKTWTVINLIDDAQEKMGGEYILDSHYITSLIESTVDNLGMMVFNACVLAPEGGEQLYDNLDNYKAKARHMILSANALSARETCRQNQQEPLVEEPEYELLKKVLSWFTDNGDAPSTTVRDFIGQIYNHVMICSHTLPFKMEEIPSISIESENLTNQVHVLNLFEEISNPNTFSSDKVICRPLQVMEMGARMDSSDVKTNHQNQIRYWIATVDEHHLSLCIIIGSELIIRVEASLHGNLNSDYIFIYSKNQVKAKDIIPPGFHEENTGKVQLSWIYDVPTKKIEELLIVLGKKLFCNPFEII